MSAKGALAVAARFKVDGRVDGFGANLVFFSELRIVLGELFIVGGDGLEQYWQPVVGRVLSLKSPQIALVVLVIGNEGCVHGIVRNPVHGTDLDRQKGFVCSVGGVQKILTEALYLAGMLVFLGDFLERCLGGCGRALEAVPKLHHLLDFGMRQEFAGRMRIPRAQLFQVGENRFLRDSLNVHGGGITIQVKR